MAACRFQGEVRFESLTPATCFTDTNALFSHPLYFCPLRSQFIHEQEEGNALECHCQPECNNKASNKMFVLHTVFYCLNYLHSNEHTPHISLKVAEGCYYTVNDGLYCTGAGFSLSSDVICTLNISKLISDCILCRSADSGLQRPE